MRLKKIKLSGFKSFAQSTEIHLSGQLVGVVGPNGCGKSNVIDAVKWVLGESRAHSLRGDSMQDVLFNGSFSKPAAGRAMVELLFENKGERDLGAFGQYAEIAVARVLLRGGNSDYFINRVKVRKRDVAELFSGTGLSSNAYAIISQGSVSQLIEAKPEELRAMVEEVAGVARYKERKKETENRLKEAQMHLARLNDLAQELAQAILNLKQQAHTTALFNAKTEEKKETQNLLWRLRFQEAKRQEESFKLERFKVESVFEKNQMELNSLVQKIEESKTENEKLNQALQGAQHQFYAENSKFLLFNQEKNAWEKEKENTQNQIQNLEKNKEEKNKEKEEWIVKLEKLKEEKESLENHLKNNEKEKEKALFCVKNLEESFHLKKEELDLAEQNARETNQNYLLLSREKMNLMENLKKSAERKNRLWQTSKENFDEAKFNLLLKEFEIQQKEKEILKETIFEKKNALTVEKEKAQVLKNEWHFLEKKQTENQALKKALLAVFSPKKSLFLENLSIQHGFEKAVECVLKEKWFARELENLEDLLKENLKEGCFFEKIKEEQNFLKESLINKIEAPKDFTPILSFWLKEVWVCENLEKALQERGSLKENAVFVTPKGEIIARHHVILPGNKNSDLEKQQELKRLEEEEKNLNEKIMDCKNKMEEFKNKIAQMENNIQNEEKKLSHLETILRQLEIQLEKLKTEKKQKEVFLSTWEKEKECLSLEEEKMLSQQTENELLLKKEENNKKNAEKILREKKADFENIQTLLNQEKEKYNIFIQKEKEETFKIKMMEGQMDDFQQRLIQNEKGLKNIETELERNKQYLTKLNQKEWNETLIIENKLSAEKELKKIKEEAEKFYVFFQNLEEKRLLLTQNLIPLQNKIAEWQLKETRALDFSENIKAQFLEQNENEKNLVLPVENPQNYSQKYLQNKIQNLNHEIELLGAVNLMALEELHQKLERQTYLNQQLKDLNSAVESLQNAILKIDYESEMRFNETLSAVNVYFKQMFDEIFGGGVAVLERVENGLSVMAKPLGKKNARLLMLSGGEKALTALALVFSFFLLQPAPFCLLDEVDAPLDDANTERFCHWVKKMSEKTQFLFVSHNKIAMAMAEQLIGVTMQEQGVSRVVDVDVLQAIQLGEGKK